MKRYFHVLARCQANDDIGNAREFVNTSLILVLLPVRYFSASYSWECRRGERGRGGRGLRTVGTRFMVLLVAGRVHNASHAGLGKHDVSSFLRK